MAAAFEQRAGRGEGVADEAEIRGVLGANREREGVEAALKAHDLHPPRAVARSLGAAPRGHGVGARTKTHVEEHQRLGGPVAEARGEARGAAVEPLRFDGGTDHRVHHLAHVAVEHGARALAGGDHLAMPFAHAAPRRRPLCSWRSIASRSSAPTERTPRRRWRRARGSMRAL